MNAIRAMIFDFQKRAGKTSPPLVARHIFNRRKHDIFKLKSQNIFGLQSSKQQILLIIY